MRLSKMVDAALDDTDDDSLPDTIGISRAAYNAYFDSWLFWLGTGRRFLPRAGGLGDQSLVEMNTILELDGLYESIMSQERKQREEDSNAT